MNKRVISVITVGNEVVSVEVQATSSDLMNLMHRLRKIQRERDRHKRGVIFSSQ